MERLASFFGDLGRAFETTVGAVDGLDLSGTSHFTVSTHVGLTAAAELLGLMFLPLFRVTCSWH